MRSRCVQKRRGSLALSNILLPLGVITDDEPLIRGFTDSTGPHTAMLGQSHHNDTSITTHNFCSPFQPYTSNLCLFDIFDIRHCSLKDMFGCKRKWCWRIFKVIYNLFPISQMRLRANSHASRGCGAVLLGDMGYYSFGTVGVLAFLHLPQ